MEWVTIERHIRRGVYGVLVAMIYGVITLAGPLERWISLGATGFLIGSLTSVLDYLFFLSPLRKQPFLVVLSVRILAYLLVILLSMSVVFGTYLLIFHDTQPGELLYYLVPRRWLSDGSFLYGLIYTFSVLFVWQFVALISRLLGPNTLVNYITGKYHTPKEESRIFMFLDIRSSTTIAEKLGHVRWHQFLNDFFFDIAAPVRKYKGEIYQYVGDEVVISWPEDIGLDDLNCIRCFFGIEDKIDARAHIYERKYGFKPVFKVGYHMGVVVVGVIGDYKRDIVFHGDSINTAARIQESCNLHNRRLLLSEALLRALDLKGEFVEEYITNIRLRGKTEDIKLYSLDPVGDVRPPEPFTLPTVLPEEKAG